MKLNKAFCCMFLFSFFTLTVYKTQKLLSNDRGPELANRNVLTTQLVHSV